MSSELSSEVRAGVEKFAEPEDVARVVSDVYPLIEKRKPKFKPGLMILGVILAILALPVDWVFDESIPAWIFTVSGWSLLLYSVYSNIKKDHEFKEALLPSALETARDNYLKFKAEEKEEAKRKEEQAREEEEKRKAEEERKKREAVEAERLAKIEAERKAVEEKARKEEEARLAAEAEAERKRQEFLDQEKARIKEEIRAQRLKDRSGGEG